MGLTDTEKFQEKMRMLNCIRSPRPDTDLLTALLDDQAKTTENVLGLRRFIVREMSSDAQLLEACDSFLIVNGVKPPAEVKGASRFRNALDELDEEERLMNAKLNAYCRKAYGREYQFPRDAEVLVKYSMDPAFRSVVDRIDIGE